MTEPPVVSVTHGGFGWIVKLDGVPQSLAGYDRHSAAAREARLLARRNGAELVIEQPSGRVTRSRQFVDESNGSPTDGLARTAADLFGGWF